MGKFDATEINDKEIKFDGLQADTISEYTPANGVEIPSVLKVGGTTVDNSALNILSDEFGQAVTIAAEDDMKTWRYGVESDGSLMFSDSGIPHIRFVQGGGATFNDNALDADFLIKGTGGTAYKYDSGLFSHLFNGTISGTAIKDEDDMVSDSATHLATQQSIKKYVDDSVPVNPLTTKGDLFGYDSDEARIPVGTEGQILFADPTDPTGLGWKDESTGGSIPFGMGAWSYDTFFVAPPANGTFRLNNADPSLATEMFISDTDAAGVNKGNLLAAVIDIGTELYFQQSNDRDNYFVCEVETIDDVAGYNTYGIKNVVITGAVVVGTQYIAYAIGTGSASGDLWTRTGTDITPKTAGDTLTLDNLAGLADSIAKTDVNGKFEDTTVTIDVAPANGSMLVLQEYAADPATPPTGALYIVDNGAGSKLLTFFDGVGKFDMELTPQ